MDKPPVNNGLSHLYKVWMRTRHKTSPPPSPLDYGTKLPRIMCLLKIIFQKTIAPNIKNFIINYRGTRYQVVTQFLPTDFWRQSMCFFSNSIISSASTALFSTRSSTWLLPTMICLVFKPLNPKKSREKLRNTREITKLEFINMTESAIPRPAVSF